MTQRELKDIQLYTLTHEFSRAVDNYNHRLGVLKRCVNNYHSKEEVIERQYQALNKIDDKMNAIILAITMKPQNKRTEYYLAKFSAQYEELADKREALM